MLTKTKMMVPVALTLSLGLASGADEEPAREGKADQPRVFVTHSESWSVGGEIGLPDPFEHGSIQGGAKPQTAEIVKTVHDRCPGVIVTRKEDKADYVLVLEHEGGKVFFRKDNKFALFNADGDAIASGSTRSLGNAVKDACEVLHDDWYDREER